ncbi:MAG: ABC transporter ATP-binding protein [Gammaproteobacteria bacterium]
MLRVEGIGHVALGPISLKVGAGKVVALMGPSGAGKSLLLRAIADLDPHEGQVWLDDVEHRTIPAPGWRRQVMYVPAQPGWWAETVGEHYARAELAVPLIERLGFTPGTLDWSVARLSSGERQRLALARALEAEPRVLLLDEPTASLDEEATAAVESLIRLRLDLGVAVLIVTHDAVQAQRLSARILHIANGRVEGGVELRASART